VQRAAAAIEPLDLEAEGMPLQPIGGAIGAGDHEGAAGLAGDDLALLDEVREILGCADGQQQRRDTPGMRNDVHRSSADRHGAGQATTFGARGRRSRFVGVQVGAKCMQCENGQHAGHAKEAGHGVFLEVRVAALRRRAGNGSGEQVALQGDCADLLIDSLRIAGELQLDQLRIAGHGLPHPLGVARQRGFQPALHAMPDAAADLLRVDVAAVGNRRQWAAADDAQAVHERERQ
jgi:hypothetical protein